MIQYQNDPEPRITVSGSKLLVDSVSIDFENLQGAMNRVYLQPDGSLVVRTNSPDGGYWLVAELDLPPRTQFTTETVTDPTTGQQTEQQIPVPLDLSTVDFKACSLPTDIKVTQVIS